MLDITCQMCATSQPVAKYLSDTYKHGQQVTVPAPGQQKKVYIWIVLSYIINAVNNNKNTVNINIIQYTLADTDIPPG